MALSTPERANLGTREEREARREGRPVKISGEEWCDENVRNVTYVGILSGRERGRKERGEKEGKREEGKRREGKRGEGKRGEGKSGRLYI